MRFTVSFLTAFLIPGAFAQDDCPAKQIYVKGVGCLPKLDRNGKTMVYKHQPSASTLASHRVKAELCGGHVASVLSSEEQVQMDNMKIRGSLLIGYSQPTNCNQEPRGCWEWDDGSAVGFTHWHGGEPNDSGGEDCVEANWADLNWNDLNCSIARQAVYILPSDFTKNVGCEWYVEPECRDGRKPLAVTVNTLADGDQTTVSLKRWLKDEQEWAKRKSLFKYGFESNSETTIDHCLSVDHCYKLSVKDKGKDGMGGGSYKVIIAGDTFAESDFKTGGKEYHMINCK